MKTIGSIESFTGGEFAAKLTSIPGASKFYKGSVITYASNLKEKLGVDISNGVINAKVAKQMALKGKKFLDVDICIAFTGNAGPEAMENKPVGLVYIAINENVYKLQLKGDRTQIRQQAIDFAFQKIKNI